MNLRVIHRKSDPASVAAPIDLARIRLTSGGDAEFERELLDLFVTDTAERVTELERLIVSSDFEGVRRAAHTIKGASASIGAPVLREAAYLLEREASIDDLSRAAQRLAALRSALEAVTAFVEQRKTV